MNFAKPKKTKRPRSDRRWTLLFIGDHGDVITLKRFKVIVVATAFVFLLSSAAVAILIYLNADFQKENNEFKKRIEAFQKRIETLRHEKEILMARLVLSESKIQEKVSKGEQRRTPENTPQQMKPESKAAPESKAPKVNEKKPPVPQKTQTVSTDLETTESEPAFSVAVEDFRVLPASDSPNLNAQFKIRNTTPQSQKVTGHAVVVLKSDDLPKHKWLVMPAVGLVGDKPSGKRGKRFSIQRFRTMNLTSRIPKHSDKFRTAAVYVYLKSGELILEEEFPVALPPVPVAETQTPSADSTSAEAPSLKKPSTQTPSIESPPAKTPADETPAGDDLTETLKDTPPVF